MRRHRGFVWASIIMGLACATSAIRANEICCGVQGPPLVFQFDLADFVLYGHFTNPGMGQSDFVIERILKSHEAIQGKTQLTLPRQVVAKNKFIVFGDSIKGKIDAYKGTQLSESSSMVQYLEGALKLKGRPQPERLRYAFDFLGKAEFEVSQDAFREFARADYADYKHLAAKLPADKLAAWLRDGDTPPFRYGLYAMLLGHCGKADHAELLRTMMDQPEKRKGSGLPGFMAGYTMLDRAKGWDYVKRQTLGKEQEFLVRYSGLQTMRFFWDNRPDIVGKSDVAVAVAGVLNISDMADFAIEDLRKWKQWDYRAPILDSFGKKGYGSSIMKRAILRYALQCPQERAKEFVKEQRARDREWVAEVEEALLRETQPAAPAQGK